MGLVTHSKEGVTSILISEVIINYLANMGAGTHRDDSLTVRVTVPRLLVDFKGSFGCQLTDKIWHFANG